MSTEDEDYGNLHVLITMALHELDPLVQAGWEVRALSVASMSTKIAGT